MPNAIPAMLTWFKAQLLAIAKPAVGRVFQEGRRLFAQRRAASGEAPPGTDRIAAALDLTIGALTGRADQPSRWQGAIAKVRQAGINPDPIFLVKASGRG